VLWDCISFLDEATVDLLEGLGGIQAVAISHPHYYASMVDWSEAFGGAPIYLHEADREFVMRPDKALKFWGGEGHDLAAGLRLIRVGGHFEGSTVLAWAQGASGAGVLLTGDSLAVSPGGNRVSALRSFPNNVPLRPSAIRGIWNSLAPYRFDRLYGAFWESVVQDNAKEIVENSLQGYVAAITDIT
jgi:glyoxylase-like metal-dependent hydrolase (beta-lactamase superfamily II)